MAPTCFPRVQFSKSILLLSLAFIWAAPAAYAQGPNLNFLSPIMFSPGGSGPVSLAIADFNGDGKPDLAVGNRSGSVSVFPGQGDGTFGAPVSYQLSLFVTSVTVADVNGDGKADLIAAAGDEVNNGYVYLLLGNGDGTFNRGSVLYAGSYAAGVAAGDLNGDGKPDIVVVNPYTNSLSVFMGKGDGTFQTAHFYPLIGGLSESVALADLNHDGKLDVVVATRCAWQNCYPDDLGLVNILLGNGDGTFQTPFSIATNDFDTSIVNIADLNRDGNLDIIAYNSCAGWGCFAASISVILSYGEGSFFLPALYPAGGQWGSCAIADINGDGIVDAVATNPILYLLGQADGTFASPVALGSDGGNAIAIADLNGDDRPDIVVANIGPNKISVYLRGGDTPTETLLTSSLNPSVYGQAVTFTASVTSFLGTPDGPVVFRDGSSTLGSSTLLNGRASITVSGLSRTGGKITNPITALYQGSLKYYPSTSPAMNQVVGVATTVTSIRAAGRQPAEVGRPITYFATVTSQYGGLATGNVQFQDNGTTIRFKKLVNNQASLAEIYSTTGTHTVMANYLGDWNNNGSVSPLLTEQVLFPSATTIATSGSPSHFGEPVTFTANVSSGYTTIPDGESVNFYSGSTLLATVPLVAGAASFTTASLSAEKHTIKATYPGDSSVKPSSAVIAQVVVR